MKLNNTLRKRTVLRIKNNAKKSVRNFLNTNCPSQIANGSTNFTSMFVKEWELKFGS